MEAGERIAGRYKIIRTIGKGGMAKVYLARDLILDRDVAVKLMAYDFHNDEDSIRRFKREALSTTELVHPNIVNIYDVEEAENPYIVMEYVEGADLKEYIHDHHPIPYKKSLAIMDQILEAVEYAHHNGIIHRDIKPQNILIDKEGNVKITDFGIAVALSQNSITQTNSLLGSVHYLSPEQARGSMATKQSDIYSLGILLYELLTGDVPFDGESAVSIALKHFQNPLPSLRQIDNRIPQPLENVVLKATTKDANQRYSSVHEMKEDLRTSLSPERSGEPIFEPRDPNDEDTRVIEPIVTPYDSDNEQTQEIEPIVTPDTDEENKEDKPEKKKKRRWWLWILIPLLLLIGGVAAALYASRPQEVQVPPIAGMTEEEAIEELEALNLIIGEITRENSEEVEEGIVIDSDPSEGATIRENQEVDLTVSLGPELFVLEDYTNEEFNMVRAELSDLGFTVEQVEDNSDTVPAGNIISQDIEAGEEVIPRDSTITFTVSAGEAGFVLSDLTGYSRQGVQNYADSNGLSLNIEEQSSDDVPEGQVISQSPAAGSRVVSNDELTVIFSTGPDEPDTISFSHQITIAYEPTGPEQPVEDPEEETDGEEENGESADQEEELLPNQIQIYIEDAENSIDDVFQEFTIRNDTDITLPFTVIEGESARYRVVRDGEEIEDETVSPNE